MQCPYCRTPLTEATAACPNCNLDLERAKAVLGPLPLLSSSGFTILSGTIDPNGEKPIYHRMRAFRQRFPQCGINVLICQFPEGFPPATYLFWLFNCGGFSGADQIRGRNRDILLGVDPDQETAGLIVGYGLEPFLGQEALDQVLADAVPLLRAGNHCAGIVEIIDGLDRLMEDTCRELPATLGLEKELAVETTSSDY